MNILDKKIIIPLPIFLAIAICAILLLPEPQSSQNKLFGTTDQLPPAITSLASSTVFLVPNDEDVVPGSQPDLLFGTSSRRIFLRLWATTTVGIYVTLDDTPCRAAAPHARYFLSASTTATAEDELEFKAPFLYTGAIHVCGLGGTTSISAIQATY